ncbi:MAG TPA: hypothetical protein PKA13_08375 [Geminicoccaceae bacterium]|nr:hypothetical protein [Geminicoccus sp.]HMU49778.1 hypothetical protein [Geminicoccaceae bacterium]
MLIQPTRPQSNVAFCVSLPKMNFPFICLSFRRMPEERDRQPAIRHTECESEKQDILIQERICRQQQV